MSPRVSVGLPVYNGENFVAEAIQSILNQDFEDFELIITDNASTDETEEICHRFAVRDHRIRYVRNDHNLGAATNYNRAFDLSLGEFFKWSAHDDFLSQNFLREAVRVLEQDPEAVIAYGKLEYVDENSELIPRVGDRDPNVSVRERIFPDMTDMAASKRFRMLVDAGGSDNAMFGIMRRSALAKTSLHRKYYMSDRALLVEMAMLGKFVRVPGIVLYNRDHPGRSTKLDNKLARSVWINPAIRNDRCFEHWSLLLHQIEIAYHYRGRAPLHSTLFYLACWACRPFRIGCYILEMIGVVSPSMRRVLGRKAWIIVNAVRGRVEDHTAKFGGQGPAY